MYQSAEKTLMPTHHLTQFTLELKTRCLIEFGTSQRVIVIIIYI